MQGDPVAWRRWWEYEASVRGLRWWRVGHGLATSLGVTEDVQTDEQIAAEKEARGVPIISVHQKDWWTFATKGEVATLLTLVERSGATVALEWLLSVGARAQRIEYYGSG
jgi:hypothetical protein